jgi:hypothetical protein
LSGSTVDGNELFMVKANGTDRDFDLMLLWSTKQVFLMRANLADGNFDLMLSGSTVDGDELSMVRDKKSLSLSTKGMRVDIAEPLFSVDYVGDAGEGQYYVSVNGTSELGPMFNMDIKGVLGGKDLQHWYFNHMHDLTAFNISFARCDINSSLVFDVYAEHFLTIELDDQIYVSIPEALSHIYVDITKTDNDFFSKVYGQLISKAVLGAMLEQDVAAELARMP